MSLDRFKVLTRAIISDFNMAWRKNFTKILTYRRGGRLSTPYLDGVDFAPESYFDRKYKYPNRTFRLEKIP